MRKELIEWSKWVIAINFGAATGCIIAFDIKSPISDNKWAFLLAILFFSLNVLASIVFTFYLIIQNLPEKYYRILGLLQIWLFIFGLIGLLIWLVDKNL